MQTTGKQLFCILSSSEIRKNEMEIEDCIVSDSGLQVSCSSVSC